MLQRSPRSDTAQRADRLVLWASLTLAAAVTILVPLYHGLTRFYLANSDQDIDLTYQALMLNAGRGVPYHPHTGFGYALLLAPFLSLARLFGFIEVDAVDGLIGSTRFDALYTEIVAAGRLLTILFSLAAVAVFGAVVRLCGVDRVIAGLATLIFATSLGMGYQFTVLRTELPSMLALLIAAAAVLLALRWGGWRAVLALCVASFAVIFAAMIKVQAILIAAFLPLLPFFFPPPPAHDAPPPRTIALVVVAAIAIGGVGLWRLGEALTMGQSGSYQAAMLAGLVLAVTAYSIRYLRDGRWIIPALAALAGGAGAAASLVYIADHWWTLYGLANFIEFLAPNRSGDIGPGPGDMAQAMFQRGFDALSHELLEFRATPRDYPLQLVYAGALAGCLGLGIRHEREAALRAFVLLAFGFALIVVFSVRGYAYYYQIYTEPFFILAGAIVASAFAGSPRRRRAVLAACVGLAVFIAGATTRYRLIAPSTGFTRGPEHACCSRDYATLIGRHFQPYCDQATVACPLNWDTLRAVPDALLKRSRP